jgi:hypothetical protein
MPLEITVDRTRADVNAAIVQFAARRGYRLSPSRGSGALRIENHDDKAEPARLSIEFQWRRGKTVVAAKSDGNARSDKLLGELSAFLADDRVYQAATPAQCPKCGEPVTNVQASFCRRCGARLVEERGMAKSE